MKRQRARTESAYDRHYDIADEEYYDLPARKVVKKSGAGGTFLLGLALVLATVIITLGVIVATSILSVSPKQDEAIPVEPTEQPAPTETTVAQPSSEAVSPAVNIDQNGQVTGDITVDDDPNANPTQSFFASKGTLSDVSALGYLGQKLNDEEQRLYLQLHSAIDNGRENVEMIEVYDKQSIVTAWECLCDDHPEFFWLDGQYKYTYDPNGHTMSVQFGIGIPLYEMNNYRQQIENKAVEFQQSIPAGASQYDIALKAYEYIVGNTEYDETAPYNQNIVSVFINGRSVCAGYARAYQYLLYRAGMFCSFVHGRGRTESGEEENHAWNLICIDGIYAYVDTTWGDKNPKMVAEGQADWGEIRYAYFGMPTVEVIATGHSFTNPEWWPQCDSYDLNVYKRNGMLWDRYDRGFFHGVVKNYIAAGQNTMEFQFTNAESWQACIDDLKNEECLEDLPDWMGVHRASWNFLSNDTTRAIRFSWQEE